MRLEVVVVLFTELGVYYVWYFFFQAEDGIRDDLVTGVQTCALPICPGGCAPACGTFAHRGSARLRRSSSSPPGEPGVPARHRAGTGNVGRRSEVGPPSTPC